MQFSAFICLDPHISQVVIDDVVELTNTQKILLFLVLLVIWHHIFYWLNIAVSFCSSQLQSGTVRETKQFLDANNVVILLN